MTKYKYKTGCYCDKCKAWGYGVWFSCSRCGEKNPHNFAVHRFKWVENPAPYKWWKSSTWSRGDWVFEDVERNSRGMVK